MLCFRCSGLLVRETFDDLREETARQCAATRCINCGYIEDALVRANRLRPDGAKRSSPRHLVRKRGALFVRSHSDKSGSI